MTYVENKVKVVGKDDNAADVVTLLNKRGITADKDAITGLKAGEKTEISDAGGKTYTVILNAKTGKYETSALVASKEITKGAYMRDLNENIKIKEMQIEALTLAQTASSFRNKATDDESQRMLAALEKNGVNKETLKELKDEIKNGTLESNKKNYGLMTKIMADAGVTDTKAAIKEMTTVYRKAGGDVREPGMAIGNIVNTLSQERQQIEEMRKHADNYDQVQNYQKNYEFLKTNEQLLRGYHAFLASAADNGPIEKAIKYANDVATRTEQKGKTGE